MPSITETVTNITMNAIAAAILMILAAVVVHLIEMGGGIVARRKGVSKSLMPHKAVLVRAGAHGIAFVVIMSSVALLSGQCFSFFTDDKGQSIYGDGVGTCNL